MMNIVLGALIFGYAAYSVWKFVQRSKQGKCAACALNKACAGSTCNVVEAKQTKQA
ncbi:FeoB-associated Cys-rich membrane protein [Ectobacillus ponti]|uniref:FeoB-associated Cys-rich membrane protein n=1 Tax=Ectobacillus ponti TaxID=2961894 RepID=A0AA42BQH7_9BACI|nr:FeoB-associated Cys-rich membrane protein [Ectobacillus ponti]MCP8970315.1 FeoB-associated Cys-rich membrane protein [Ectobacillus ponti]